VLLGGWKPLKAQRNIPQDMKVTISYALFVWVCNLVSHIMGRTLVEEF